MDEKDIQNEEFTLDDIIKEFSGSSENAQETAEETVQETEEVTAEITEEATEETAEEAAEEIVEETAEEVEPETEETVEEVAEEIVPEETPEPVAAQTVTSDTIRIEKIPDVQGQVRNAVTIDEETETPAAQIQEKAEPYSDQWEPEYEQPISEYVPQGPLAFRPKSRLREIKKKLVAGPEKHYYSLSEIGLGKLQAAIFFSVLVVLLSAGATALYALDVVPENRLRLMVFGQFLAMLLSALLGSFQLIDGLADLVKGRFSLNTLLLFTFAICCADGVLGLRQLRVPCCAAFSLQVTMALWSAYQTRNTRLGQLDTMRKASHLDSVAALEDYDGQGTGLLRTQGEVEHFMDTYRDAPKQQKILSVYAIVALVVSIGAGVLAGVLHGVSAGIQVASVTMLAAMPASMFVIFSRPMAVLERRLHGIGTVFCGWQGAWGMTGKSVFPLDHTDLFPLGSVKMNGMKFFGKRSPDEIVAYAAALIKMGSGTLEPLFTQLLDSRSGVHYDPQNFQRYEGGVGAQINGEAVLAGTLPFLKDMGVEVPEGIRLSQAAYVAVEGELCGLFALTYEKNRSSAAGLATLCGYRQLRPVLLSDDFMLTPEFIHSTFGVNPKKILFPDEETRIRMQELKLQEETPSLALITGDGLAAFAYAVTGARSLRSAVKCGITIHLIGGILGMLMMLVLAYLGETDLLTPANLFLYELIWLIPGLMATEMTRSI